MDDDLDLPEATDAECLAIQRAASVPKLKANILWSQEEPFFAEGGGINKQRIGPTLEALLWRIGKDIFAKDTRLRDIVAAFKELNALMAQSGVSGGGGDGLTKYREVMVAVAEDLEATKWAVKNGADTNGAR